MAKAKGKQPPVTIDDLNAVFPPRHRGRAKQYRPKLTVNQSLDAFERAMIKDEKTGGTRAADAVRATMANEFVPGITLKQYLKQKPSVEAVPALRRALFDDERAVSFTAARILKKIGPPAVEAVDDLFKAAEEHDVVQGMPQCYCDCLEALVEIIPGDRRLVPFIRKYHLLDNWHPITASLRALKKIGTPDALKLFDKIVKLFDPKFSTMQRRVVTELSRS